MNDHDSSITEAAKFWGFLERLLERDPPPSADDITDLLGEYRQYSEILDADAAENEERRHMMGNAIAIQRGGLSS